ATGTATNTTDSTERLTADSGSFRRLTTGAAVAPAEARSAKVRLMMRPRSAAAARAYFDAVTFEETSPPAGTAATAAPAAGALGSSDDGSVASSTYASPAPTAALGTEDRPVTLVNVHSGAPEGSPLEGGGRGLDPLVLGLGIGIPLTAAAGGGAYWWARRRLAWGRKAPL
ncbi:MAG: hypothetical protein HYS09_04125, partial [Chloroflexi bacterium]|nr:hypothetical protein [Chloroflexota bacterium]